MDDKKQIMEWATDIVAAYVSQNTLATTDVPGLLRSVFEEMQNILSDDERDRRNTQNPAVPIEQSITDDYLICLEDGQQYKSLKRHLRTKYHMTPKAYREKWGLPADYPMVAKNYSKERSRLAKRTGLGKS